MARVVTRFAADAPTLAAVLTPRRGLVHERAVGHGRFEAERGPVRSYLRQVQVDGEQVTQTLELRLAAPYFGWLFLPVVRRHLGRPQPGEVPWWAPPQTLDARASTALGTLAAIAVVYGYLNTLFTQTIAFAGEEFHAGNSAQGVAGSVVRLGGIVALVLTAVADRRGRRVVLLGCTVAGSALALTGALAPSLGWLTASQLLARAFASALLLVGMIVAGEEMPAGCRAWAVSLLAMAAGLGSGICVLSLRLADIDPRGWRLLYVLPILALPLARDIARQLPESRRYLAAHSRRPALGAHRGRLALLAASGFLSNLFIAPESQFSNRYLRHERHFSGGRIGLLSVACGSVGVIGIVAGGRLAERRGRRQVAAVSVIAGTLLSVVFFFSRGWPLWAWCTAGTIVSDAQVPALLVYGPELFPTGLRGLANGAIGTVSLIGSAVGLAVAGLMADAFGHIGPALAVLSVGPILLGVLVLVAYPETAGRELEELNPEDPPLPASGGRPTALPGPSPKPPPGRPPERPGREASGRRRRRN
ncbi:MAG: MFS transporter [Acidimicrobiales bacterium]